MCRETSCTDAPRHPSRFRLALVVAGGVERQLPQQFAAFVENPHVQVVDQHEDPGAGVAATEADVEEPAVVAERDHAAGVDPVEADAVVPVVDRVATRRRLRSG